jgi:hypothetical protein
MTIRTTVKTVRFTQPFRLGGIDDVQPPGDYDVTTDEEQIGGMNIQGWRRSATAILLSGGGTTRSYSIDPTDLEASLMRDAGLTMVPSAEL